MLTSLTSPSCVRDNEVGGVGVQTEAPYGGLLTLALLHVFMFVGGDNGAQETVADAGVALVHGGRDLHNVDGHHGQRGRARPLAHHLIVRRHRHWNEGDVDGAGSSGAQAILGIVEPRRVAINDHRRASLQYAKTDVNTGM